MTASTSFESLPWVTIGTTTLIIAVSVYVLWTGAVSDACYGGIGATAKQAHWLFAFFMHPLVHMGGLHLWLNVFAYSELSRVLEKKLGHAAVALLLLLCFLATGALGAIFYALVPGGCAVGASGVIFALLSFWAYGLGDARIDFCGTGVPAKALPWVNLLLVQVVFWKAAFGMHLAGLLAGIALQLAVPGGVWRALGAASAADGEGYDTLGQDEPVAVEVSTGAQPFPGQGHRLGGP